MSFSDSDWDYAAQPPAPRPGIHWLWSLAAGIAIGAAATALAFTAAAHLRDAASSPATAIAPASVIGAASAPPLTSVVNAAAEPTDRTAAMTQALPAPALLPSAPVAALPRATATVAPPSAEERQRKERAWARFYQRPTYCDGNPSADQLIDCANHFIRSKREFDVRFATGQL